MKQILKKVSALLAVAACSTAVIFSGSVATFADEGKPEIMESIQGAVGQLTEELIGFSDEELQGLIDKGNGFTISSAEAWMAAREEVGAFVSVGEPSVEFDDKMYAATVPVDFETYDANFVYIFNEEGIAETCTVDIQYPLSENMKRAGMNTVMGLGTVFMVLVFLMFIISLFKFVGGGKKKTAAPAAAPAPAPAPVVEEEEYVDDLELIAVIAAAIAASEGAESADGYVVKSIRKVNRRVR
ncbi:MAG: OadG family protein [Clostridiales bacterium]|nr:OadG family protein [Candidatus Blautia equi]